MASQCRWNLRSQVGQGLAEEARCPTSSRFQLGAPRADRRHSLAPPLRCELPGPSGRSQELKPCCWSAATVSFAGHHTISSDMFILAAGDGLNLKSPCAPKRTIFRLLDH